MSERSLVSVYMSGGGVGTLISKQIQEGIDPTVLAAQMAELDKASAIRKDQKSITDADAFAIRTYGTIEQIKANVVTKLVENGDTENISLLDQKAKLYCMMNENKELPLKQTTQHKPMNPMLKNKIAEKSNS